ncbi:MAG: hypothetical protein GSR79_09615 [Desulfurococcales archaeon]|nr:hypothetical protein [Desulfurococcales archaeon]
MLQKILKDNGEKEVPILITYLIPFTFNPIYMVNALRHLDRTLFPKMSKNISEYLNNLLDKGLDPLTALQTTSENVKSDIISRLLANYVYVAKNVGSATMLTVTFLEKALESIRRTWENFRNYMNVVVEVELALVMMAIIGVLLVIFSPQGASYIVIIPLSVFFLAIASLTGYIVLSPGIGNPFDEFPENNSHVILYYSIILTMLSGLILLPGYALQILMTSIIIGFFLEYRTHNTIKTFNRFIDELSAILNSIEIGYPGTPSINRLVGIYGLRGRIGKLLRALNKGVSIAGETGLRGSFSRIVNVLNSSYKSFSKYRITAGTYTLLITIAYIILVYTSHSITGFYKNNSLFGKNMTMVNVNHLDQLTLISAFLTPVAISLSYRPRTPPIFHAGLNALAVYIVTHFL